MKPVVNERSSSKPGQLRARQAGSTYILYCLINHPPYGAEGHPAQTCPPFFPHRKMYVGAYAQRRESMIIFREMTSRFRASEFILEGHSDGHSRLTSLLFHICGEHVWFSYREGVPPGLHACWELGAKMRDVGLL